MDASQQQTTIVTGSNTGIGRAAATALAAAGMRVVLACRSEAKTAPVVDDIVSRTGNPAVEFLPLDLADLKAVRRSAEQFLESGQPLHLLVNNAGVAGQRGLTVDGFELTFGVNHLGHFHFTNLLLDRIVAAGPARIVNVSSGNHYLAKGIDFDVLRRSTKSITGLPEYNVSKLANVLFTRSLAERLDPAVVSVFAINPGPVASEVWRRIPGPALAVFKAIRRMKSVEAGARPVLYAANEPGVEDRSGGYVDEDDGFREVSRHATPELAAALWQRSQEWIDEYAPG